MNSKINTSAIREEHVPDSNTQTITQLVAKYKPKEDCSLIDFRNAFNLAMFDLEEKKFKEYVKYVVELTNGFESTNQIAYNHTRENEIRNLWIKCVNEFYPNLEIEVFKKFIYNLPVVHEAHIVENWLEYFATESSILIEMVTDENGNKSVYATNYALYIDFGN